MLGNLLGQQLRIGNMQKVALRSNGHYLTDIILPENAAPLTNPVDASFNVFTYQCRVLPVLLAWAMGSITAGVLWWRGDHRFWRGVGSQFMGWGAIDAALAIAGMRGATLSEAKYYQGELPISENLRQTKRLELVFWVNTGLDVLYMLGGKWLIDHPTGKPTTLDRRGMGWGVILQSVFLLVFDLINALILNSKRQHE